MKKFIKSIAIMLAIVTCCGIAACSQDKGGSNVLWLTISDSSEELLLHTKLAKAFVTKMKEEGKEVTVKRSTFSENDYGKGISTLYATKTLGDVIFTYDTYAAQYTENGTFEDLDSYIQRDDFDLNAYNEDIIASARAYQNQLTYFPRSYDQVTIFINNEFFRDMGLEDKIPKPKDNGKGEMTWDWWTWNELLSLCNDLRNAIDTKMSVAEADYYYPMDANLLWNAVYDPIIKSFGGYVVDVETMNSGFNSANTEAYANTINALEFMKSLMSKKYTPESYGSFTAGNQAMAFQTRPNVVSCNDAMMDLSFAPVPRFDTEIKGITTSSTSYVGYGSAGYALNKRSSNKDLAWEFIKFTMSEEGQDIIAGQGYCIPTLKSQLNANAKWTEAIKNSDGDVVEQSAFLYSGNTLSLATYARGVQTETEYNIYNKVRANILDKLCNGTAKDTATYLYSEIKSYIK